MTPQELWQWVHYNYGDDLGLTDGDDDYTPPTQEDELQFKTQLEMVESGNFEVGSGTNDIKVAQVSRYIVYFYTGVRKQNTLIRKIFKMCLFFCIFPISPNNSILCQKNLVETLLQSTFCYQTLYITNVCRVISRITEVALLNNFRTVS